MYPYPIKATTIKLWSSKLVNKFLGVLSPDGMSYEPVVQFVFVSPSNKSCTCWLEADAIGVKQLKRMQSGIREQQPKRMQSGSSWSSEQHLNWTQLGSSSSVERAVRRWITHIGERGGSSYLYNINPVITTFELLQGVVPKQGMNLHTVYEWTDCFG